MSKYVPRTCIPRWCFQATLHISSCTINRIHKSHHPREQPTNFGTKVAMHTQIHRRRMYAEGAADRHTSAQLGGGIRGRVHKSDQSDDSRCMYDATHGRKPLNPRSTFAPSEYMLFLRNGHLERAHDRQDDASIETSALLTECELYLHMTAKQNEKLLTYTKSFKPFHTCTTLYSLPHNAPLPCVIMPILPLTHFSRNARFTHSKQAEVGLL